MNPWTILLFVAAALLPHSLSVRARAADAPTAKRWWSHVAVLADDKLEGRNTGSPGHRKAAEYVAAELREQASNRQAPTATFSLCI